MRNELQAMRLSSLVTHYSSLSLFLHSLHEFSTILWRRLDTFAYRDHALPEAIFRDWAACASESYPHVSSFRLDIAHVHERGSRNHYPYTKPKEFKHS
jgi:hypothetical protein